MPSYYSDLYEASKFIGENLRLWGRVNVVDYKEKYATVRVYCDFGWYSIHNITHPGYHYVQWKIGHTPVPLFINYVLIPYQQWLYRLLYKRAIKKWPYLKDNILNFADHPELLKDL